MKIQNKFFIKHGVSDICVRYRGKVCVLPPWASEEKCVEFLNSTYKWGYLDGIDSAKSQKKLKR